VLTINWDRSTRLKNIEETEKAKRVVAEDRKGRPKLNNDEEHLAASRCEPYLVLFSGTQTHWVISQSIGQISNKNLMLIFYAMRNWKQWGYLLKKKLREIITVEGIKWQQTRWYVSFTRHADYAVC
jgi:hypothetical protein